MSENVKKRIERELNGKTYEIIEIEAMKIGMKKFFEQFTYWSWGQVREGETEFDYAKRHIHVMHLPAWCSVEAFVFAFFDAFAKKYEENSIQAAEETDNE